MKATAKVKVKSVPSRGKPTAKRFHKTASALRVVQPSTLPLKHLTREQIIQMVDAVA